VLSMESYSNMHKKQPMLMNKALTNGVTLILAFLQVYIASVPKSVLALVIYLFYLRAIQY
jgi:hypothetical protein